MIRRAPFDDLVADFASRHHCPTVSWGVVLDGRVAVSGATGDGPGVPITADTVYRIASMTKSFSAAVTLLLRDDGTFGLDDAIGDLDPALATLPRPTLDSPPITIRDLLGMTSGFVTDDAWADRHLDLTDDDFDRMVADGPVYAHPTGTTYEYSNFGFAVLGRVVERCTGTTIQQHITTRLLEPLGLERTSWTRPAHDDWMPPRRRLGDIDVDELAPLGDGLIAPMGGLWTTVADLAVWVAWLADAFPARGDADDGPLCRASRREMQTTQRHVAVTDHHGRHVAGGYGYGLRVLHDPLLGVVVTHSGGLPGYGSNMRWLPGRGVGVIALSNTTYAPMTQLGGDLLELLHQQGRADTLASVVPERLDDAARRLVDLLNGWTDEGADDLFADNVDLDDDWARRRAAAEATGPLEIDHVEPVNAARAKIHAALVADDRTVVVSFALSPVDARRIQNYDIVIGDIGPDR
ncbi:MAG: serine hydrolase domain-containing protein [Ilumatobacteraceae bacterium]